MTGRPEPECTGVAARWCDRCGQCTCPDDPIVVTREAGVYLVNGVYGVYRVLGAATEWKAAPGCPLHDMASPHPIRVAQ